MGEKIKRLSLVFGLLIFVIVFGTFGYVYIEGWSYFDSFYMTAITITTVGYGETKELSNYGRLFTVFLISLGYVIIAIVVAQIVKFIVESEFKDLLSRNKTKKRVKKMKNHYIICGYGNIGKAISIELKNNNIPFVIIDQTEENILSAEEEGYIVIKGNMTQDQTLIDAGVDRAAGLVACVVADADNLFISLAARELNPMMFIIAKGEEPGVEARILRAGADIVVSPVKLGGQQVANLLIKQIEGSSIENNNLGGNETVYGFSLTQFKIKDNKSHSVIDILKNNNAMLPIAIKRKDGSLENNPENSAMLRQGDRLIATIYDSSKELKESTIVEKTISKRILIADDHRGLRMLFVKKLAAAGNIMIEAKDGLEAIEMSKKGKYDLIILDVVMPFKSGYEVCEDIRMRDKDVPIVLYSSDESSEFIRKGSEVGATECLRKTSKSNDLLRKVNELILNRSKGEGTSEEKPTPIQKEGIDPITPQDDIPLEKILNIQQLKDITDNDVETIKEIIQIFIDDTPIQLKKLSNAIAVSDFNEIKSIGHYLKGGASNIGFILIEEFARKIEDSADDKNMESIKHLYNEIENNSKSIEKMLVNFDWTTI